MFSKIAALGAFVAAVAAQSNNILQFNNAPSTVTFGQTYNLQFASPDNTDPITITLQEGPTTGLEPVVVLSSTLYATTQASYVSTPYYTGSFSWTVGAAGPCLSTNTDYALSITQSGQAINYWGHFSLSNTQGCSSSSSSASGMTSSATSTGWASTTTQNVTSTWGYNTTTVPVVVTTTNCPVSGNTTFSSATLSATGPVGTSPAVVSSTPTTGVVPSNDGARSAGSNLALVMGVLAGLIALN